MAEVAHDDAHDCDEEVDEDEGHDHVEQVEQPDRQVPAHPLPAVKQLWSNLSLFCCVPILIGTKRGRIVILKYAYSTNPLPRHLLPCQILYPANFLMVRISSV